ncbi:MAG TPA: potassium transporter Kup [Nitrococcus sp.]|nr:potassium transporter Kup [Nitrococcus sp.]
MPHERTALETNERPKEETAEEREERVRGRLPILCLAALGVVYGDLGTSPLYTLRASFFGLERLPVTPANVLGVLSLIFWSLIIVVSVKYLLVVMRADNRGEGGILALTALFRASPGRRPGRWRHILIGLGIFGAALLYGDGMITPAITVLSAIEGLHVVMPASGRYVIPVTIIILIALFVFQKRGTGDIGRIFGPIMLLWFVIIAALGAFGIARNPTVLAAVDPAYAVSFFAHNQGDGFLAFGGVVLCLTGAEALYADLGHFGRSPIRVGWFYCVLPALFLNYFGQGAVVMMHPGAIQNPFYRLAPSWALYPLIILATAAAVIASQAVISGVFQLTRQAARLGQAPPTSIVQTSAEEVRQVYVPSINWLMMFATIGLVLGFHSSNNLASAYGVAITATMLITSLLLYRIMLDRWRWPYWVALPLIGLFLLVDTSFFGANIVKVVDGGWFPLLVAGLIYVYMTTWRRGRELLHRHLEETTEPAPALLDYLEKEAPVRVEGTAVFLVSPLDGEVPPMLLHHLRYNRALHERVVLLTVHTEDVSRVPAAERLEVVELGHGLWRVSVRYGFMQSPNVPVALRGCERYELYVDLNDTTFYVGRQTLIPTDKPGMMRWRERLFAFMVRNSVRVTQSYKIPPEQVVELGIRVEL